MLSSDSKGLLTQYQFINPVTEEGIENVIIYFKAKTSSGYDSISTNLLNSSYKFLISLLVYLINKLFEIVANFNEYLNYLSLNHFIRNDYQNELKITNLLVWYQNVCTSSQYRNYYCAL